MLILKSWDDAYFDQLVDACTAESKSNCLSTFSALFCSFQTKNEEKRKKNGWKIVLLVFESTSKSWLVDSQSLVNSWGVPHFTFFVHLFLFTSLFSWFYVWKHQKVLKTLKFKLLVYWILQMMSTYKFSKNM